MQNLSLVYKQLLLLLVCKLLKGFIRIFVIVIDKIVNKSYLNPKTSVLTQSSGYLLRKTTWENFQVRLLVHTLHSVISTQFTFYTNIRAYLKNIEASRLTIFSCSQEVTCCDVFP